MSGAILLYLEFDFRQKSFAFLRSLHVENSTGQVVSVITFKFNNSSLNPDKVYNFIVQKLLEGNKNKQKRPIFKIKSSEDENNKPSSCFVFGHSLQTIIIFSYIKFG